MEIKFNLKDAKVYLPSNRIMNLKEKFNLNKIEFSEQEVMSQCEKLRAGKWELKMIPIEAEIIRKIDKLTKENKSIVKTSLENTFSTTAVKLSLYGKTLHNVTESVRPDLEEMVKKIAKNNFRVQDLQNKLKKLKAVNQS